MNARIVRNALLVRLFSLQAPVSVQIPHLKPRNLSRSAGATLRVSLLGMALVALSATALAGLPRWAGADMNGDGKQDVLLYNSTNGGLYPLLSNGDGTFRQNPPYGETVTSGYDIVGSVTLTETE